MAGSKGETAYARFQKVWDNATDIRQLWQDCATYGMPRKSNVTETKTVGSDDWNDDIYDDEAIHSVQVLASGQRDWLFSGRWVEAQAPWREAPQGLKDWYARTGEIVLEIINASNFPLEIHEFLLDRSNFHTSHLHCDEDDEDVLLFSNDDVGEYVCEEDERGFVSTIWCKRKFTALNAVRKWGKENVGKCVMDAYNEPQGAGLSKEFDFVINIGPRDESERVYGKIDKLNKPILHMVLQVKDKHIVFEGGYNEKPFVVSRYLKWGRSPYGYGPMMLELPVVQQLNGLEKLMDALAELQAFPRMLIPEDLEGVVGFGPSGVTIFNPNAGQHGKPTEWATAGRYDIGKDRSEGMRARIRRAFHVELFQMLTNMDEQKREKTATEVRAMLAERVSHFSPTFERLRVEVLKPLLNRVFSICYRKGLFPPLPEEIFEFTGTSKLEFPEFIYTSKLALAVKASENMALTEFLATIDAIFQISPESVIDEINAPRVVRMVGENVGLPVGMWNTQDEKEAIQDTREQKQAAEEQMALAESASNTASNLSKVPSLANLN